MMLLCSVAVVSLAMGVKDTAVRGNARDVPLARTDHGASTPTVVVAAMQLLRSQYTSFVDHPGLIELAEGSRVHVASSSTHGRGLFATQDLPQRTVAALYPVDALGLDVADGSMQLAVSSDDADYFSGLECPASYRLLIHEESGLCIEANPERPLFDGWLGHMINDGDLCRAAAPEEVSRYRQASLARQNCVFVPFGTAPLVAAVTTRPVRAGGELLTSYGLPYWSSIMRYELPTALESPVPADVSEASLYHQIEARAAQGEHAGAAAALSEALALAIRIMLQTGAVSRQA